jgi:uncharacterized membrane protein
MFNLQVIWAIGVSMIVLSLMIYMSDRLILLVGILLIAAHNLLDNVHIPDNFFWAFLHESKYISVGRFYFSVHYPVLPWIGLMAIGYYFGRIYTPGYDPDKRRTILLSAGVGAIMLFILLRSGNFYGDAAHWAHQKNLIFSLLSFLNVTKYPPSLLYILVTMGPALILLVAFERPLNSVTSKIVVFGRVPFFYYVMHIYLIHLFALAGAAILGYNLSDMILTDRVNRVPWLKGYGFNLSVVYLVWIGLVVLLYPLCNWFGRYKRAHQSSYRWLSYV